MDAHDDVRIVAHHVVGALDRVGQLHLELRGAQVAHGRERVVGELEGGGEFEQRGDLGIEDHGVHVGSWRLQAASRATLRQNAQMQTDVQAEQRARYLVAMEKVVEASDRLIDALRDTQQARGIVREHMAEGGRLSDLEHIIEPGALRAAVSSGIAELERTRHQAQRLLFRLLQAEGQSMTNIARRGGSRASSCRA